MELSAHVIEEIDHWLAKYPPEQRRSAVLGALRAAQHENNGYLTVDIMDAVAEYLGLAKIFYSMFELKQVGRHSISVCTNISCMLCGGEDILAHLENKLGIKVGETTLDGRVYLKPEEECLAACCGAPMMMVDHKYYENLTTERVDEIVDGLE